MAVYRNVQVNFWQDEFILDLTPEERYFYIYLLTGTKTKQCGIYILPKRLAELETGYSMETVEKLLNRFVEYGKILYDAETKELFIINWLHYNPKYFGMPEEEVDSNSQQVIIQEKEEVERVEDATPHSEVYKFYEQNISSLSPYIAKELKEWMQRDSGDKVLEALKIAFENNKGTLAYVKGILRNWCKKGRVSFNKGKEIVRKREVFSLYDP
ncbi:hypothetical protein S2E19_01478 [Bacillus mycoides]|uniref:DnaD domain-containing protein n=1 Tax=Bacillus mycoides TaxID=1405 RepID=UPI000A27B833|nr:DnaD domain protein [Bacillus mycoides]MED1042288.1 DnaD domain protein [Bacillus mycoides]OSY04870.1 hypothetical protein S2E19_01478 [Bacillus mycoides]